MQQPVDMACNSTTCKKRDYCARNRSYKEGNPFFKTFGGSEEKGCGKFIPLENK